VYRKGDQLRRFHRLQQAICLLFIGFYLILGGTLGHGFVWCVEPGDFTHLEFNLAGSCGLDCEATLPVSPLPDGDEIIGSADCRDFSAKSLTLEASAPRLPDAGSHAPLPAVPLVELFRSSRWPQVALNADRAPPDRSTNSTCRTLRTTVLRY